MVKNFVALALLAVAAVVFFLPAPVEMKLAAAAVAVLAQSLFASGFYVGPSLGAVMTPPVIVNRPSVTVCKPRP